MKRIACSSRRKLPDLIFIGALSIQIGILILINLYNPNVIVNENKFPDTGIDDVENIEIYSANYWNLSGQTILIDNNQGGTLFDPTSLTWEEAKDEAWCSGSGTWNDPYIIENVTVDGSSSGTFHSSIMIAYSTVPFIIRNCTLCNSQNDDGLILIGVRNGLIINNNCSFSRNGISIGGIYFNDAKNNTISGNIINNNTETGLWLESTTNNTISRNIINNNIINGIDTVKNNAISATRCLDNIISENNISENGEIGMNLKMLDNSDVVGNNINNNQNGTYLLGNSNYFFENQITSNNYGLIVRGSHSNRVIGNNLSFNDYGIHLFSICDSNNFSNNNIRNNTLIGAYMDATTSFSSNYLYENYFINNGLHALDNSSPNAFYWNSSLIGNYWDNYTGPDLNGDNIGDNPYNISGSSISKDFHPIIDPFPPLVSNVEVSDDPLELEDIQTITAQVTDDTGIEWVRAYLESPDEVSITNFLLYDDGVHNDGSADDAIFGNTWDSAYSPLGQYFIDIRAQDNTTFMNIRDINNGATFLLEDSLGPTFSNDNIIPESGGVCGQIFDITIEISDPSGIYNATAYIQNPDETTIETLILYDDGTHNDIVPGDGVYSNAWDSTGYSGGTYYIDVVAYDNSNSYNKNETENIDNDIILINPPISVTNIQANPSIGDPEVGTIINITCDANNVKNITAEIESPDETLISNFTLYDDGAHNDGASGDGTYGNTWNSSGFAEGMYFLDIIAKDLGNNTLTYDNSDTFSLIDNTPPTMIDFNVTPSNGDPKIGTVFNLTCEAIDFSDILSVVVYIEYPDETNIAVVPLYDDGIHNDGAPGDGVYGNTWDCFGQSPGLYYLDMRILDDSFSTNEWNGNNIANLTLIDSINPSVTNISDLPDEQVGYIYNITCNVSDMSPIDKVLAYVQHPDGITAKILPLYDDGTHNDGALGDGLYGNIWDSSGFEIGNYFLDIFANDTYNNINYTNNGDLFTLSDNDGPIIQNISIFRSKLELGDIQIITCNISDPSGIYNASATIESPDETVIATVILYDDGTHNDIAAGDGIYGNVWDSDDAPLGNYVIDITAYDNSLAQNARTLNNCSIFEIFQEADDEKPNDDQDDDTPFPVLFITLILTSSLIGIIILIRIIKSKSTR